MLTDKEMVSRLRSALQWMLDDLDDAGETRSETGEVYDSVQNAADALAAAGGSPPPGLTTAEEGKK